MCGRYTNTTTWAEVHAFSQPLELITPAEDPSPCWNIAPTQPAWVIRAREHGGEAEQMRWGLVPSWARDVRCGASMINARCETVAGKPAFRAAFRQRRCLVPASGYYEWQPVAGGKQPYWIHPVDGPVMMFAGLWEAWRQPDAHWLTSFAILTCPADGALAALHDRRPVMLERAQLDTWLHGSVEQATALIGAPPPAMAWHPVDRAVGNVRNQGAQLVAPV